MKKYYLTMLVAILSIVVSQAKKEPDFTAQDFAKYNIDDFDGVADGIADFKAAALNIKANFGLDNQGYVGQTTVIDCPGMSKQDIYVQARLWLEEFCKKDKKAELRLDGDQGSTLIARKRILDVNHGEFEKGLGLKKNQTGNLEVNLLVNIRVDVKDEKCRLTTTIEDYGIYTPQNNGGAWASAAMSGTAGLIGGLLGSALSSALNTEKEMKPANNYPFVETYQPEVGMKEKKIKKATAAFEQRKPVAAVAFVASFLITQIVHDKMVAAMTSAPAFGNNDDW